MTKEQMIQSGLRAILLFPETVKEVEEYEIREMIFGNTDINFPIEEQQFMLENILNKINTNKF